jgi:transposase
LTPDRLRENVVPHRLPQVRLLVVSMQSTGVYSMPVMEVLEQHGLEAFLVNTQHTKMFPGARATSRNVSGCSSFTLSAC